MDNSYEVVVGGNNLLDQHCRFSSLKALDGLIQCSRRDQQVQEWSSSFVTIWAWRIEN